MKYPRPVEDDGGGLDSLLDTMTNVVGILVMVLIATQLGVKDAVNRIADSDIVDPAAIESEQANLTLTEEQRDLLLKQLDELKPVDDSAVKVQLEDLRRKMQETRAKLTLEAQETNRFSQRIADDTKKAEDAKKKVADAATEKEKMLKLQEEVNQQLAAELKLKAQLDRTPVQEAPPPKVLTLPDPRPAPPDARQVIFLCSNNKVYPIAADDWRATVRKKAEFIVKSKRLDGGPSVGVDKERFLTEFKRANRSMRDDFFEVELFDADIYPRLRFIPKENSGATEDEISNPRSRFQQMLNVLDKDKYFARFIVLPDSFEVYLTARAATDAKGILSGWDPQAEGWQYTTNLGGPILFGPKPPPDPNAKPTTIFID